MAKGSGRSDCFRIGVTYGYRECPRKGRARTSSAADLTVTGDVTNLRRAYMRKALSQSGQTIFIAAACQQKSFGALHKAFLGVSERPYIEKIDTDPCSLFTTSRRIFL